MPSSNVIVIEDAPSTTCDAVTMWPSWSMTKPVPVAVDRDCCGVPPNGVGCALADETPVALMSTTPADVLGVQRLGVEPAVGPVARRSAAALALDDRRPRVAADDAGRGEDARAGASAEQRAQHEQQRERGAARRPAAGGGRPAAAATAAGAARPAGAGSSRCGSVLVGGPEIGAFGWTQQ